MKIKDLIGLNPEAEIVVVDKSGQPFEGELSFGWDTSGECAPGIDTKAIAQEVHIFLSDTSEITQDEV